MTTHDLTIVGAGAFGLAIAWECLRRGARVNIVDPNPIGAGASGGIVGALSPHTPDEWNIKKAFQLRGLVKQHQFWQDVETASGLPSGFRHCGRVVPLADDRQVTLALGRIEAAAIQWPDPEYWEVRDEDFVDGWGAMVPKGKVQFDSLSSILHPRKSLHALHAAVQSLGGSFLATVPENSAPVIWATGWQGLGELTKVLGKPIGGGEKGQAALIDLNCSHLPQLFAQGVHFIPHADGTVAIGSTTERDWNDLYTDGQLTDLIAKATTLVPMLKGRKVLERWAGVRPKSARRTPLLGRHPTRQDHFVANGGYKIGLGLLPVVAETMADLVLDGKDAIPEKFTPTWLLNNA